MTNVSVFFELLFPSTKGPFALTVSLFFELKHLIVALYATGADAEANVRQHVSLSYLSEQSATSNCFTFFRIDASVPKGQHLVTEEHAVIVVEN